MALAGAELEYLENLSRFGTKPHGHSPLGLVGGMPTTKLGGVHTTKLSGRAA